MFPGLTDLEAAALVDTARAIGTDPSWLWELVNLESGHNPQARNPSSGARGLIQFMPSTAKLLGYASADALVQKHPTHESQMRGPVQAYFLKLAPVKAPYKTRQALYMKVFVPAAMNVPPDTTFQSLFSSLGKSDKYIATFHKQNPGVKTVADYVNKASKTALAKKPVLLAGGAVAFAGFAYLLSTLVSGGGRA
jgi:hypothetical protein